MCALTETHTSEGPRGTSLPTGANTPAPRRCGLLSAIWALNAKDTRLLRSAQGNLSYDLFPGINAPVEPGRPQVEDPPHRVVGRLSDHRSLLHQVRGLWGHCPFPAGVDPRHTQRPQGGTSHLHPACELHLLAGAECPLGGWELWSAQPRGHPSPRWWGRGVCFKAACRG